MLVEDIDKIIKQGEGLKIEFKEATDNVPKSFYETVVSFSNTDGGTIILGVDDHGKIIGINPDSSVKLQKDIVTALNSRDCVNPPLYVQPILVQHQNGLLIAIQIQASSQVHDHKGFVYSREFESDLDITSNQHKISDLYLRKRNLFSESQIFPHLNFNDLDTSLFQKARQLIRNYKSDHPWLLVDDEQMLKDSILWRKDFNSGQEGFTLAAALIFGKEQTIQSLLPAYKVEAMVRIVNKDRWDDRVTLRKNLIDTYLELKQFINKHLPEKFFLEGDQRVDLRDKIFREVIGNIIVHREYTSALSTDIIITGSEVTLSNANKALFHGPIDPAGFNPYPKNPNIRKFFTAFGWTDEIGSGIRNTYKYLPLYIPGAKPSFIENDTFHTLIPLQWLTMGSFAKNLQEWLELPVVALPHLQKGLEGIPLTASLIGKDWTDVLLHLIPSWHFAGIQLNILNWPEYQIFEKELSNKSTLPNHSKVPSSNQKGIKSKEINSIDYKGLVSEFFKMAPGSIQEGTKLLAKRSRYLISILTITSLAVSRDDLMLFLNYENRKTFNDLYMQPLLQCELIKRTNKENPRASNQQYVITESGKAFLSGILQLNTNG
jgi:ATP-dependent DNA helicase RecG